MQHEGIILGNFSQTKCQGTDCFFIRHEACTTETLLAIKKYLQLEEIPQHPQLPKTPSSADLAQGSARSKATEGQPTPTKVLTRNSETALPVVTQSPRVVEFLLNQVEIG